jgi:hypothetical protein
MTKDEADAFAKIFETIGHELAKMREDIAQCRTILERMLLDLERANRTKRT